MLLTDEVAGPVDEAIADNDGMFERHKPADEAWNHYFRCGRSALRVIRLALAAVFTRGHCLLIGVPGLAKTLMVSSISQILSTTFKRIQFTPDLMP